MLSLFQSKGILVFIRVCTVAYDEIYKTKSCLKYSFHEGCFRCTEYWLQSKAL